ncbi:hypothetical protein N1031_00515 [Herbiconiux moechotypicola]|uniref:Uncharacterized protein n=1 Tax=Herbiconiux moechotypicola TaxID=637393 RepID=A0ABN3D8J3_9MICO|nr:hypothetical protein [Herbiconiux moechotypicola]MCS5728233.1 hypothetical protein [Herbiconiux moechotypicola]
MTVHRIVIELEIDVDDEDAFKDAQIVDMDPRAMALSDADDESVTRMVTGAVLFDVHWRRRGLNPRLSSSGWRVHASDGGYLEHVLPAEPRPDDLQPDEGPPNDSQS